MLRRCLALCILWAALAAPTLADAFLRQVERASFEAARTAVAAPDRFEPVDVRMVGGLSAVDGPVRLELLDRSKPNQSGMIRLTFRVHQNELPRGSVSTVVRGSVRGPALVATQTLRRDAAIESNHVRQQDSDLTRTLGSPVRDVTELAGMVPSRTLASGRVVEREALRAAYVVERGQAVALVIRSGRLTVVARGQALGNAAVGEAVEARNATSGVRVLGRALADGSIQVDTRLLRTAGGQR